MQNQYPNLSRAIEGFLLHKTASGLSPNTLRNYKNQLRRLQDWTKNPTINEISPRNLEEFFQFLQNEFRITHVCGITPIIPRKLSPKTIIVPVQRILDTRADSFMETFRLVD